MAGGEQQRGSSSRKAARRASSPTLSVAVASTAVAALLLGAAGALPGRILGGAFGALLGTIFALLSPDLSILVGTAAGTLVGLCASALGGTVAALCGAALGGALSFTGHTGAAGNRLRHIKQFVGLVRHGKYGHANKLTEVACKDDLRARFNASPTRATQVGQHFPQYLEEAVHMYRILNDNKTGASTLKVAGQPGAGHHPELAKFESIIGNFERSGDSSGWMFAKREAEDSPIGKRELWLVVRGSTTLIDWALDAEALESPEDICLESVGICTGFYTKAISIINDMERRMALDAVSGFAARPFDKIFIVGHSLGGAVVTQFQSFTAVPLSDPSVNLLQSAEDNFNKLQRIWSAALGDAVFSKITPDNVCEHFLTFALEPAPAFKSIASGPRHWESDAHAFQSKDSVVKRILERTLILTLYGADPVTRLNVEIAGLALPPVKLGVFYSSPDTIVMPLKYKVKTNTFYLMDGPLVDNRIVRFLTWSADIPGERFERLKNITRALQSPHLALQLAAGNLGADHVAMFKPDTFVKGLQELP